MRRKVPRFRRYHEKPERLLDSHSGSAYHPLRFAGGRQAFESRSDFKGGLKDLLTGGWRSPNLRRRAGFGGSGRLTTWSRSGRTTIKRSSTGVKKDLDRAE
jgi:hypothetical protein